MNSGPIILWWKEVCVNSRLIIVIMDDHEKNSFIFPHAHFSVKWQDNKIVLHLLDFTSSCKCNTTGWTKVTTTFNGCSFWIVSSPASPLLYFCAELHENNVILDQSFLYSSCYRTHFVKGHALLASFFFIHDIQWQTSS